MWATDVLLAGAPDGLTTNASLVAVGAAPAATRRTRAVGSTAVV
jgi:hypothetical protein